MKCNICQKEIDDETKKMILGEQKFNQLESQALMGMFGGNLVKCPYKECGEQNQFEPGSVDYNIRDDQNKVISREAAEEYAKNRCKCGFCKKDFCKECLAMPYHLGLTCKQKEIRDKAKKCRFCDSEIKGFNRGPDDDVCNQNDCKERYMVSCKKRLPCGHKCFGVNGEFKCPPCIDNEFKYFMRHITIVGIINYYITIGDTPEEALLEIHKIIGRPCLPPYWTLGWHQSRWGYKTTKDLEKILTFVVVAPGLCCCARAF